MAKQKRKRTKPRAIIRIGHNPGSQITIIVPGKSRKGAASRARSFVKRHIKNVEMGFYDSTGFHPIRASKDYSMAQAGERRPRSYKARFARLRSATKHGRIR